jgi:ABC-2 type transport system permease protein
MVNPRQKYAYAVILLRQLVKTDFKLRYQGSTLGYIWSLLRPLLLFLTLYIVFIKFLRVGGGSMPHPAVYLLLGILLWNYFSEVTNGSINAIVGKGDLLRKLNFPKYIIIIAGSVSALINLVLTSLVIVLFMVLSHVTLSWAALWIIPLVVELFLISIALAFFLSALFVRFRDVSYIWEVVMQAAFYATPILYPLSFHGIPIWAKKIMMLNPMAQIIQDARHVLISPSTETIGSIYDGREWVRGIPLLITLLIALLALRYFRNRAKYFAEEV